MTEPMDIDTLRRILVACAGEDETAAPAGDILDIPFTDLGYDSLALMESAARIKQDFGVDIADDVLTELETPRALLDLVNGSARAGQPAEEVRVA
ncbi:acyl carrier protein [Streptomyces albireticuli]|uniref:Acyl carrier protein n=1 Tax=Streptomyces albireticuli TaxID=1940 RepID=A0A1Z2KXP4_9ACTN|nr:acyl carrier protein [Streptomyces albireticuli]ARZ66808.1 acyl carrier protein [Streptomyces albireticuli]